MNRRNTLFALLFSTIAAGNVQAASVINAANLDKVEAMLPQLQKLQQRVQNNQFNLQQHCDWPRHYNELSAQETDSAYQQAIEQIVKQHGFTPVQFVELSAKISWPVLDSVQPALELARQALLFLPPAQRQQSGQTIIKGQQYYKTLTRCLTSDDQSALAKHHNRIMQLAKRLGGIEQLLPVNINNPDK